MCKVKFGGRWEYFKKKFPEDLAAEEKTLYRMLNKRYTHKLHILNMIVWKFERTNYWCVIA